MFARISLTLAASLPFLVLFNAVRNVDLQGGLLIVSGGFAWFALLLGHGQKIKSLGRLNGTLLSVFAVCCVISLLVNPHFGYDLLGAPYLKLGTAGLLSCIGIGWLARGIKLQRLSSSLYSLTVALAIVSVPYSWLHFHTLIRMGGVFAQADIMACFMGIGLILGLEIARLYPQRQKLVLICQGILAAILLLTQTRAVLFLVIVLVLLWTWQNWRVKSVQVIIWTCAALILFYGLHGFLPNRLTSVSYASQSIHYRLTLQRYALEVSGHHPLWGYGPGNLADALSCPHLPAGQLQATCSHGYFFNSSHNIFLDRILAIGWFGGLSYLALVVLAIYRGLRTKELRIFGYVMVLIGSYYLTNVTGVTLELLLWVLLLRCLVEPSRGGA